MRVPRLDAATCYTWLGDDEPAEEHAREFIAYHTRLDGSSNAPMGTAINTTVIPQVRERKSGNAVGSVLRLTIWCQEM